MHLKRILLILPLGFLLVGLMGTAVADEADDLAKQADKTVRAAERNMMSGKKDQAVEGLLAASGLVEKLKTLAPEHSKLRILDGKVQKLKRDLERRTGKTIDLKAGKVQEREDAKPDKKVETNSDTGSEKLPGAVTSRLKKVDGPLKRVEQVLSDGGSRGSDEYRIKEARRCIQNARQFIKEIESGYAAYMDHPEVKAAEGRIAAMEKKLETFSKAVVAGAAAANKSSEEREAHCAEWMKKIGPYVISLGREGHDPDKYLMTGATQDMDELKNRERIYKEATAVFQAYRKIDFPSGKTAQLEQAEKDLAYALEDYPKSFETSIGYALDGTLKKLDQQLTFLASEAQQKWRKDTKQIPYVLPEDRLTELQKSIDIAAKAVSKDQPALVSAREKLSKLAKLNQERQRIRTERTFMIPDRFKGGEVKDVKAKAIALVLSKFSDAKALRTTVITEDWKEERVLEATDTTNTAIRYRVTRSVSAQVAARLGKEVFLYTVHVAKDQRTDGSWGALYGNVMFTDPMLEKNVKL